MTEESKAFKHDLTEKTNFIPDNVSENAPEKIELKHSHPRSPPDLNNIIMLENPYEPNDDKMKIEDDKIDRIIEREKKRKNSFSENSFEKKN